MSAKQRIIGYGRESTREQAKYGFNLDDQEKKIRKYVELYYEKDAYDLEILREEGASAKSLDRPKMNDLMNMVRGNQVDTIIIHNLDRLTRQVRDLSTLLEEFKKYNVQLISITEKIDTETAMGRFFIFMIVLIAQWEWETISSRSIRGIEESARQGNYALGGHPLGYRRNPEDNHKLIIHDEEATVIRRIFNSIANEDYSLKALRNELNAENVLGRTWSDVVLQKILDNKIYYGTFCRFGVEYPNHTIPIITQELYDTAQLRLNVKDLKSKRNYIYKGFIYCKDCGSLMSTHSGRSCTGDYHHYYQCWHCNKYQASEKIISKQVVPEFDEILKESRYMADIEYLKKKYGEISNTLDSMTLSELGADDNDYLVNLFAKKEEEKKKLEICIKRLQAGLKNTSFEKLPFSEQRKFLSGRVQKMIYDRKSKSVIIHWRPDDDPGDEGDDDTLE